MSLVTILGSENQDAFITLTEASALLTDAGYDMDDTDGWAGLTDAQKELAIRSINTDIEALPWAGRAIFDYQPYRVPTDAQCTVHYVTADTGGGTTSLVYSGFDTDDNYPANYFTYGAAHVSESDDADYALAAQVSDYTRVTGTLTLSQSELTEAPDDKSCIVITPLPKPIRTAFAIQAFEKQVNGELLDAVNNAHAGFTTGSSAAPGSFKFVGNRALWHMKAYSLLKPYLAKQGELGRA